MLEYLVNAILPGYELPDLQTSVDVELVVYLGGCVNIRGSQAYYYHFGRGCPLRTGARQLIAIAVEHQPGFYITATLDGITTQRYYPGFYLLMALCSDATEIRLDVENLDVAGSGDDVYCDEESTSSDRLHLYLLDT